VRTKAKPQAPRPRAPRRGGLFRHRLGPMRIIAVTGEHVTFTYADDDECAQYPRRMERSAWQSTYGGRR
jgi:hypothetical protein